MSSQCPCYECDYVRRGYGPPYYPCARTGQTPTLGRDARQIGRTPTGYTPRFQDFPPTGFTPQTRGPFRQTGRTPTGYPPGFGGFPPTGFTPQPRVPFAQNGYASMAGFGGTGMTPHFVGAFGGTGLTPQVVYGTGMGPGLWGSLSPTGLTPSLHPPFFPPAGLTPGVPPAYSSMLGNLMTPYAPHNDRSEARRQEYYDSLRRESEAYNRRHREEYEQRTPRPGPTADRRAARGAERPPFGAEDREPSYFHSDSIRSGPQKNKKPTPKPLGLRHSESAYDDAPVAAGPSKPSTRVYDDEEVDILRQERTDLAADNRDLRRRLRETEDTLVQSRMQEQWLRDDLTEEMLAREFALLHNEDVPEKDATGGASAVTEGAKAAPVGDAAKEYSGSESTIQSDATADAETQTVVKDEESPDASKTKEHEAPK
ncbi:hypothetical protein B0A48_00838 [Cryoendolithus antarcticus]|uniref:Uncharacterized protein n=1 Tax=Cryoendolithus antarcticus TaxID=1507870 RepID=A0A1V8TRF7_9PEZI|nr:hypothetical protein B0A48_00838 [Cryoendolithus antarcticus]